MGEEGGNMLGHSRGFDRRPDRSNQQSDGASSSQDRSDQQSDRASSSQDRSAHPARNRSLLFSNPDTWEHGQTNNSESSTEVEQRLREQEIRELDRRARQPLSQRLGKQMDFQQERSKQLKKFEKEIEKLEVLAEGLEKRFGNPSNGNYLHHLYDRFQALDLMDLAQMQDIDDKKKNVIWMENMTNTLQGNEQLQFLLQEHQRMKMLELQEKTQKKQLENMAKHIKEVESQLNSIGQDSHHPMPYFTQEFMNHFKIVEQKIEDHKKNLRQRTDKINSLTGGFDELMSSKNKILSGIQSRLAFGPSFDTDQRSVLDMKINKLEKDHTEMDHTELSLKQRIQWLRDSNLRVDGAKSNPNEVLEHIKTIISDKFDNLEEQDRQINQHLDNLIDKLYGQHLQVLQDAAKELNTDILGPKMRIWKNYVKSIYSYINISFNPDKKEILDAGQHLMLEDILTKDGKSDRINNDQRESEKYKELAKSIVKDFQEWHKNPKEWRNKRKKLEED